VTDASTATRVLRAQVASLYATNWSSTLADSLLAWSLSGFFYWQSRDPMVLVWLGLHTLQLLRYPLVRAYFRDPQAIERSGFWAHRKDRELFLYSVTWGLAPWLFMPAHDLALTALFMLVMLGLSSAGVPSVAPRWRSVLAFVVPMTSGLVTALLWAGTPVHLFMAVCGALYVGATLHFARQQHLLLTESLLMRFEKEGLADQLARQNLVTQRASDEKTRFFAAASHDLRQPLHAIALFGAVLEKKLAGQPDHAHAARLMRAVHALGTSLDTLLDVSRLDAGVIPAQIQPMALGPAFLALHQDFAALAEEKGLELRVRSTPLWVQTDPALLQRLLANLLDNAIKYTARGGVLLVARARGPRVWIDLIDTGIGIAPEHAERVFDEFYQVNNPGRDRTRGLGIGLSIVRRLSRLLDHPVQLRSRHGQGSWFRVELPASLPPQSERPGVEPPAPAPSNIPSPDHLPRRVLLIDDEADIAEAATAFLEAWGVALVAVTDEPGAERALQNARAAGQAFDALICDVRLADGADGLDTALRLRERFGAALPLLLVTGETAPDRLQRVHDSGVPVLFKPVPPDRLLQALAQLNRR
jgi:signal transduction histidine kinase